MNIKKSIFLGVTLLLTVSIILAFGCAREAETTSGEFKTYSKHGFSFEYHKDMPVTEIGLMENEVNDNSGMISVGEDNGEVNLFMVSYIKTIQFSLEGGIEGAITGMTSDEGIEKVETSEIIETTKSGHRMLYQYYTATAITGERAYGIVSVFYCNKSQKAFVLMTINNTISAEPDVLENFMRYLNSFVCH